MTPGLLGSLSGNFGWLDWLVVVCYFALTTYIGHALAGKPATIRDFFLGGRRLPWYAVSGSIIATEISALTFISVPFVVFKPGGNFTYLQLGVFGSFFARILVGYILIPAYYQREIYSPYDYMSNRLGNSVRSTATALFAVGGLLAQSARVYLTAVVLRVILYQELSSLSDVVGLSPLALSIIAIGVVAVIWTLMGGITTVIWTDVILLMVFLVGAATALLCITSHLTGGWAELFRVGSEAGKFKFFDYSPALTNPYTIWTAVIAATWGGVAVYGTDQLLAQRVFCCKDARQARWALISSAVGQVITITVMLVGVGLFAYYQAHPLHGEALALYDEKGDSIFPIFIMQMIPAGLKGLIIAGVFAAAISSLDSIMAALSQTVMSAFYLPWRNKQIAARKRVDGYTHDDSLEAKHNVFVSRMLVVFWGILLCFMAAMAESVSRHYPSILDLGLAMAGYAGGGLFAGFALSFLPLKIDGRGYLFSAPLSVLAVFAMVWHEPWAHVASWIGGVMLLLYWCASGMLRRNSSPGVGWLAVRTGLLMVGISLVLWLTYYGYWTHTNLDGEAIRSVVAWPWYAPFGSVVAFVWGYLLSGPEETTT